MIYRNFLQFELLKPARLVKKEGEPEAPPAAPAEAGKPKAPEAPKPPSTAPAEQAQKGQEARQQSDAEKAQAERMAELIVNPPSQEEMDNVSKKFISKMTEAGEEFKKEFKPEDILTPAFAEKILDKTKKLLTSLNEREKDVVEYIISVPPTDEEKTQFRTKYTTKEGNLSFKLDEKDSIRDWVIFLYLATEEGPDKDQLLKGMSPETGAYFTRLGVLLKNSHQKLLEQRKADEAKKTLRELAEKYKAPFAKWEEESKEDEAKARQNLLESITDESDKQKLTEALPLLEQEKPAEEDDDDGDEDNEKSSDALKGAGIGALLERLVDKLTKLFDKLSVQIEKAFGSLERKTTSFKSPLGGDKKFTIARGYEEGKGLTIAANADEEIYSVTSGTVTKADNKNKTVEITKDNGDRTVYKNIEPSAGLKTVDDATKIESGKQMVIGKAVSSDGIGFQYFDKNNTEQDPTESFKKAELVEEKPEEPAK